MKRMLLYPVTFLLCCLLGFASAQPEYMPYDAELILFYRQLSASQQALFDSLYDGLYDCRERISLPEHTDYDDAAMLLAAIRRECAELCLPREGFSITWQQNRPEEADSICFRADMQQMTAERVWLTAELRNAAEAVSGTPKERASRLSEWLCDQLDYDPSIPQEEYTPQSALRTGKAMCASYAGLYATLCRLAGIPCTVVEGSVSSLRHAWNLVETEDGLLLADLTAMDAGSSLPVSGYQADEVYSAIMEDIYVSAE